MENLINNYSYTSHQFNPAVISSYYNLEKYKHDISNNYIKINQTQRNVLFLLNNQYNYKHLINRKTIVYSENNNEGFVKSTEIIYNLPELFIAPNKQIRR